MNPAMIERLKAVENQAEAMGRGARSAYLKQQAQELGISSVRGGGIVGDHDVLFCGPEEVVTISHVAQSRGVFADGAVQAALFLDGCEPGYYTMTDMLKGKMQCL